MTKRFAVFAPVLCLLLWVSEQAEAKAYVVIVSGLGGESSYQESFNKSADAMQESFTPSNLSTGDETEIFSLADQEVSGAAVIEQIEEISQRIDPTDQFILMLVGHGSYDGEHYRFNIPGPDLTDYDLKHAIDSINAEQQLIVLATSASGVMLQQLQKPGRIVITATKSGGEINAVVFPEYWATALTTVKADFDRNEIVTVTEAFRFTRKAVEDHYKERNLLASEHARLIGEGADQQPIAMIGSLRNVGDNPKVAELLNQRADLEKQFHALVATKDQSTLNDYYDRLQTLMLRFAHVQRSLDQETGWLSSSE